MATNFSFSEEHDELRATIRAFLEEKSDEQAVHAIAFPGGTENAAQVIAGLDQTALAETSILVKFHYGTFYVFLQGGEALPVPDTTAIVEGSADATKLLRFEVDGFTTATTRVITPPDADITLVNTSDGTISNTNVNASAAIAYSKLATLATGNILFGNAGVPTVGLMSGQASISNTGAVTVTIASTDLTDTANLARITTANVFGSGLTQTFTHASTATGLRLLPVAGDVTTSPLDGSIIYNTSTGTFRFRQASAWVELGGSPNAVLNNQANTYTGGGAQNFGTSNVIVGGRLQEDMGASSVASADAITLGADGNTFTITGTTTINHMINTGWQSGSKVTLLYPTGGGFTFTSSAGGSTGAEADFFLSSNSDFNITAGGTLTLVYEGVSNLWIEIGRSNGV